MSIRYMDIDISQLRCDEANPRTISKTALAGLEKSIDRFGLVQPIVVNDVTGEVVAGHQRLAVLRKRGVSRTTVLVGSWSAAEQRVLNVTLNNSEIQGTFTDASQYLETALHSFSSADFRTLRLDALLPVTNLEKSTAPATDKELSYRILITCTNEEQQAELLDEFDTRGLEVKPLIV